MQMELGKNEGFLASLIFCFILCPTFPLHHAMKKLFWHQQTIEPYLDSICTKSDAANVRHGQIRQKSHSFPPSY